MREAEGNQAGDSSGIISDKVQKWRTDQESPHNRRQQIESRTGPKTLHRIDLISVLAPTNIGCHRGAQRAAIRIVANTGTNNR